jgi:misacylated tRNA(Ala) deacylase
MTEALYHHDAYLKSFSAEVIEIDKEENAVVLDQTAFFPGGGGQLADTGTLLWQDGGETTLESPVAALKKKDERILHYLEGNLPEVGTKIEGRIDWERRYKIMRTHSAMHVLSGVAWRDYGAQVTGGSMDILTARMDFEFENFSAELTKEIEERVNEEIAKDREIKAYILPRAEAEKIPDLIRTKVNLLPESLTEIRVLEVVGLDIQADGGTHVARTSEIGRFSITGHKSKGKINKRLKVAIEEAG